MPPDVQAMLVYWPSAAFAAVLIAAVFAAGWFGVSMKQLKANLAAVGKNREALNAARAASKEFAGKVKSQRAEVAKVDETAKKMFWQNEKTWIG
jgi:hypothetical protein